MYHTPTKKSYSEEVLRKTVTEDNPLSVIKCKDETLSNNNKSMTRHLHKIFDTRKTMLCRESMVEI
jgi:hypothetical protein